MITNFKHLSKDGYSYVSNRRGGLNERLGLAEFFIYYKKNSGYGNFFFNFFIYYMKNSGQRGEKFLKINKRVCSSISDLEGKEVQIILRLFLV